MTSQGAPSPLELRFTIDDRPGVLEQRTFQLHWAYLQSRPILEDIEIGHSRHSGRWFAASLEIPLQDQYFSGGSSPPQMLLVDHLLRTSLFPLQHYVQRRGAILEALYRISEGFWFSPSELVMTALLHFEDKVHRKGLARAESIPLLMPRLLSQVLEDLGFPEEPRIERRIRCPPDLSMERAMVMPISFLLQQQDQEEVLDEGGRGSPEWR